MKKLTLILLISFYSFSFANAQQPGNKKFSSEFNKMKTLAGNWEGKHEMGGKSMLLQVNYKVSSAGSAVVETSFPGMPQEMVSVYSDVNGKINMTHYCALQNQPTLRLKGSTKNTLDFDYIKGANLNVKKDAHMHHLTLKFKDKNTIEQHWTQFKDGKSAEKNIMVLSRVN